MKTRLAGGLVLLALAAVLATAALEVVRDVEDADTGRLEPENVRSRG